MNRELIGVLVVLDFLKFSVWVVIFVLKFMSIVSIMVIGDNWGIVNVIVCEVGIDFVIVEVKFK